MDQALDEQFATGRLYAAISSRPGQVGFAADAQQYRNPSCCGKAFQRMRPVEDAQQSIISRKPFQWTQIITALGLPQPCRAAPDSAPLPRTPCASHWTQPYFVPRSSHHPRSHKFQIA